MPRPELIWTAQEDIGRYQDTCSGRTEARVTEDEETRMWDWWVSHVDCREASGCEPTEEEAKAAVVDTTLRWAATQEGSATDEQ